MPKLTNSNNTCYLCGRQAFYISFNSKKSRCEEKINRCPGFIAKAKHTRNQNSTPEQRRKHMKQMSINGNKKLVELHTNPEWYAKKSLNISLSVQSRGGHHGDNNPMFGKKHRDESRRKQSSKAKQRDPICYQNATLKKIENGIAVPKELKSERELYNESVDRFTYNSWQKYQTFINPNNFIRGENYELDHKISKTYGFIHNIPPAIIGHYCNLELIPKDQNRSKRVNCSITLDDLINEITRS
jgi:hypothetical protein